MYVCEKALKNRAAELERWARSRGLEVTGELRASGPTARIGHLATRLGIDLCRAFDLERDFGDPCARSLH